MSTGPSHIQAASLPRRLRSSVAAALLACAGVAGLVQADPGDRNQPVREVREVQRQQAPQLQQRSGEVRSEVRNDNRTDTRAADPRATLDPRSFEARAEEQRKALQEAASRNAEMGRRVGRMTPDERRDLRRQINEAGQDIYATPPRR